jgi:hypothetical protein
LLMGTAAATVALTQKSRRRLRKSPFFTILGVLMLALAIAGFWPQYFSAITGRTPAATAQFWLIHLHAAIFTCWLLLYISQAALVLSGRMRVHLKVGPWLAAYGFLLTAVGLYAAGKLAARFGERMKDSEEAAAFVFFPMIDMVFFGGFLAAAVVYRKRPDLHKRAMLVATYSIATVGGGRFVERIVGLDHVWIWQPLMLAPLLLAVAYDLLVCRKLYPLVGVGLIVHLGRLNADAFVKSDWWLPIGRALVAPFS